MSAVAEAVAPNPLQRLRLNRQFGSRVKGVVVPRWWLANAGDVDEMIETGAVELTADPVTERFEVPASAPQMENPPAEMVARESDLVVALAGAKSESEALRGKVAELEVLVKNRTEAMATLSDRHNEQVVAAEARVYAAQQFEQDAKKELLKAQTEVVDLKEQLDKLRKPKADKKTPTPADPPPK